MSRTAHRSRSAPRIVVLDGHTLNPGDNPWDPVAEHGELVVHDRTPPDDVDCIVERAAGAEIVLTNKTPLRADTLARLPDVGMIGVLATGYDVVDVDAAADRDIVVCNVPEYGTESVAEFVFAQILTLARDVSAHDSAVRAGEWAERGEFSFWLMSQRELEGQVLGVVGFGRIGARVAEIARAFGMDVVTTTRRPDQPLPDGVERVELDALFEHADIVTLHCPLTDDTRGMVDARRIGLTKDDALLINTARGPLVDEDALAAALRGNAIGGAALDVVSQEPIADDNPLLDAPRCRITPHMAWSTLAARERLMRTTAENIAAYLRGEPKNVVG